MRRMRQRTGRWEANDELLVAEPEQIGEIGVTARKLLHVHRSAKIRPATLAIPHSIAQPAFRAPPVRALRLVKGGHRAAITGRYRSRGPTCAPDDRPPPCASAVAAVRTPALETRR